MTLGPSLFPVAVVGIPITLAMPLLQHDQVPARASY
jgi:hypothetical protein